MKRKLLFILVILIGFAIFLTVRFLLPFLRTSEGEITIESSPSAEVILDGSAVGKTPYSGTLSSGEHTVKLIPQKDDKNASLWEGKVEVYKNSLTYVSRELGSSELTSSGIIVAIRKMKERAKGDTGQITVETEPSGAIVYLDNDDRGIAPTTITEVATGDHELSVFLPGFFRKTQKVNVEKGHDVVVKIKLALDQSQSTLEEELEVARLEATKEAELEGESSEKADEAGNTTLTILDTPTGFLNVRSKPSLDGEILTTVNPEEEFEYVEQDGDWYLISFDEGEEGWVFGDYVEVNE